MKSIKLLFTLLSMFIALSASAQMDSRELRKELKTKVTKDNRKEAKRLTKDGWRIIPGALSLEYQLQQSRFAAIDKDEDGKLLNSVATHFATGVNYSIAKGVAQHRSRTELASNLTQEVRDNVKSTLTREGVSPQTLRSVDEFISESESIATATLHDVRTLFEAYRESDGTTEVQVTVSINKQEAMKRIFDAIEREYTDKATVTKMKSAF